ncbi:MAG: hypothetical protein CMN34_05770 [Saprospirales bacterium]|nr:hypothetical protein [Saprospirales bacterium]|tara:strand:- start:1110 stop:1595 length:486 start_codon:yes stop_codon:yes gene_type:complete
MNTALFKMVLILIVGFLTLPVSAPVHGDEIVHQFKSPSFSGRGTGSHYLTIENQQFSRKQDIEESLLAAERQAEREADNTTLAKFIRNLESRIYAQLSKQLVDNMFNNEEGARFGSFALEGNMVTYEVITSDDGSEVIRMTIVDEDGTETVIEIPIGTGGF